LIEIIVEELIPDITEKLFLAKKNRDEVVLDAIVTVWVKNLARTEFTSETIVAVSLNCPFYCGK
jgi:hypothetical protein